MAGFFDYLSQSPMPGLFRYAAGLHPGPSSDWQTHLGELEDALPLRDQVLLSPGQPLERAGPRGFEEMLHPNAAGIYGRADRPPPPGDVVLPSGGVRYPPVAMPGVHWNEYNRRDAAGWFQPIAARQSPDDQWLSQNAPFPTQARPTPPGAGWTDRFPVMDPADPGNYGPGSPFGRQPPSPELLRQMRAWWDQRQRVELPEAVQRSIREQPSYGEGEIMAPQQWWNSAMGGVPQQLGPQRENYLQFDRREALGFGNPDTVSPWLRPMPEGGTWSSRPAGVSPFARRPEYPFALY